MVYKFINKNYIFSRLGQLRSFWKLRHKLGWLEFQRQKLITQFRISWIKRKTVSLLYGQFH